MVAMFTMLPRPRSRMPAPILCTVRAGQHTPAVRLRIHTSVAPCSSEPAGVLNPARRRQFMGIIDEHIDGVRAAISSSVLRQRFQIVHIYEVAVHSIRAVFFTPEFLLLAEPCGRPIATRSAPLASSVSANVRPRNPEAPVNSATLP